jgi:hypothetical protein
MRFLGDKRGQLSIFVIVSIVIVLGIVIFFLVRNIVSSIDIPEELAPVYNSYQECLNFDVSNAVDLASSQGGFIDLDTYESGSSYAPFGSELNFLGARVPYWYYISSNGVVKENIPKKSEIEKQMADFIESGISSCDLDVFFDEGYFIEVGKPEVEVSIKDEFISVSIDSNVVVEKGDLKAVQNQFEFDYKTNFGSLYNDALKIYSNQRENAFLENYSIDALRLNAPVDGVEVQCSPLVWRTGEVVSNITNSLSANIQAIRFDSSKGKDYFIVEQNIKNNVQLLYSSEWPSRVEIYGDGVDRNLMIAKPVGTQQGISAMGFCYVPYHFVYDVMYPVMFQVYKDNEFFNFPVVVVIDKNTPRQAVYNSEINIFEDDVDVCGFKTQDISVGVYDLGLNRLDGDVYFKCFNSECYLGETKNGIYDGLVPGCVGGSLIVKKEGYADGKIEFSSNSETNAEIFMEKNIEVEIEVLMDGKKVDNAIVNFARVNGGATAVLPDSNKVQLSEAEYEISVFVFGNSSIKIPSSEKKQCYQIPSGGISGLFGSTKERCETITIPGMEIDRALIGGGKGTNYFIESELEGGKMRLNVGNFGIPDSVEDLQFNYELFDVTNIGVDFNA